MNGIDADAGKRSNFTGSTITTIAPGTAISAAQVAANCPDKLRELGERIATHLEKAIQCDTKAADHRIAAGQLLAEAKAVCDEGGFAAFRKRFCPALGRSRAHELLAVAAGTKSIVAIRADNAERNRRYRANQKVNPAVRHVTETAEWEERAAEPEALSGVAILSRPLPRWSKADIRFNRQIGAVIGVGDREALDGIELRHVSVEAARKALAEIVGKEKQLKELKTCIGQHVAEVERASKKKVRAA